MSPGFSTEDADSAEVVQLSSRRHRSADSEPGSDGRSDITVVVCAYTLERWDDIVEAITSLRNQTVQPLEILFVVDHNDDLLGKARLHFGNATGDQATAVTVIANSGTKGLSGARNTGVEHAGAGVVAFLDDDASAAPDWIERMSAHYRDPNVIGVGGYATPFWPNTRPSWLPIEFDWVVGCSYRGQPVTQSPVRNFIGCNMSLRRNVFETVGGFSSAVGRIGKIPLGCEETELCIRAREESPQSELRFDPHMKVLHRVSADRTKRAYFFRRCYAEGLSKAVVSQLVGADAGLDSERSYVTKTLPGGMLRQLGTALTPRRVSARGAALQRAAMIPAGLVVTTAGYIMGRSRIRLGLHQVDVGRPAVIPPRRTYVTG